MAGYVDQYMPDEHVPTVRPFDASSPKRSAGKEYTVNVPGRITGAFFSASETPLLETEKFIRRSETQLALDLL